MSKTSSRVFGYFLCTVGALIMTASGLCTLGFTWTLIQESLRYPSGAGSVGIVLIGVIPFGIGLAIFQWGRTLLRKNPKAIEPDSPKE